MMHAGVWRTRERSSRGEAQPRGTLEQQPRETIKCMFHDKETHLQTPSSSSVILEAIVMVIGPQ